MVMLYCLNIDCLDSENPDGTDLCQGCGTKLMPLLRSRYQIIQSLGGGGFGRTYLALDQDKLKEKCVVKQFAPKVQGSWALQKATELFEQEAKRLQQLGEHPQIPTLYAYFEENKHLYLVQQFVEGQNLWEELDRQGEFSEQKIWALLSDLLPILQFVHEQQVIHRDIKPANIIRRVHDSKLVLIDFGVAKHGSAITTAKKGTTIGSHGYAPLEQMQGGEAYPASDLYSLGATCFHLLTNIDPYSLWQRQGYGWVESWQQHLSHPVSGKLAEVLSKLLEIEQQQRYQSATSVLQDIAQPLTPITPTLVSLPSRGTTSSAIASPPLSRASSSVPTMPIAASTTATLSPRRRSFSPIVGIFLLLIMGSSAMLVYLFKGVNSSPATTSVESVPIPSNITTSPNVKQNDSGKSRIDKTKPGSTSNPNSQQQQESPKLTKEDSQVNQPSALRSSTQPQSSEPNPTQAQSSESNQTQPQLSESNRTQPQSSEALPLVKEPSSSISSKPTLQERQITQTNERRVVTQKLSEPSSTRSPASDSEPLWGSSSSARSKPRSPASDSEPLWGSSSSSSQRPKSQSPKSSPLW